MSVLIVDPSTASLSSPNSMVELVKDEGVTEVLWRDEAESIAGANYLSYKGGNASKEGARVLTVQQINNSQSREFYSRTHLQGPCNGFFHLALLNTRGTVRACMSFGLPSSCRSKNDAFLLQRFATMGSIAGAASRLLINFRRRYTGGIYSFSDNRYATGELYGRLGFTLTHELRPDYRYWKEGCWYAKNSCQRRHLIAQGAAPDSEGRMSKQLGYKRCYDLGKKAWRLE